MVSFFKGSRLVNLFIVGVLIGAVQKKCTYLGLMLVESYVQAGWISVQVAGYSTTGPFMWCVGSEWPFEIAGLVRLGIVPELACLLGGGSGCRFVHRTMGIIVPKTC
jgi:hypothetical protein